MVQRLSQRKCQVNVSRGVRVFCALFCVGVMGGNSDLSAAAKTVNRSEQVDALFDCTVGANVPGASVVVIQNGKILHAKGYGLADLDHNVRITPDTVFRLGSVTKMFTAMGILQLHENGALNIDDSVGKVLTGTSHGEEMTIRHLLTHTSGITDSLDSPLEFVPGTRLSYSNTGYNMLGRIIEKVSGDAYGDYLRKHIFVPLNMVNTGFEYANTHPENFATGYEINEEGKYCDLGGTDVSGAYAAGALYSTWEDMVLWDEALDTGKLVKTETIEQAFSPVKLNDGRSANYGFGWMIGQYRGLRQTSHGGDITGFNAYMARYPDEHFTVVVLSNVQMRPPGALPTAGDLAHKIADIYLSDRMEAETERVAIKLDHRIYDTYVGQYKLVNATPEIVAVSGDLITITRENDGLYLQSKLGKVEIYPATQTLFYIKADNTKIQFTGDSNEAVTGMTLDAMGLGLRVMSATKLNHNR